MHHLIYLIAAPGSLRHSLTVLLTALGTDQQIEQFDAIGAALRHESTESPTLIVCDVVVLDANVLGELARLRSRWPCARLVVMSEDEALAARLGHGAVVITTGAAAARLRTTFGNLLCNVRMGV
ncbi:MAG: hypothetical protein R3A44_41425 [Caldilineaceae bacterium]